ncbi:MAG: DUF1573 domain-containing protein [Prevotellaceae bacterium]|jgi:hypothetical protein|nr:DUF1573 domain-containing protein [Prevotellaceae bacterium]
MRTLFISLTLILSCSLFAQDKISVVFNERTHDFGTIREENGKAVTVFTFTNTSNQVVAIKSVKTSCGCTTPSYSREPIAPNGTGEIKVAYDATGRSGNFSKNITVQIGNDTETKTESLNITGEVTPRPKSVQETYPFKNGDLLMREHILNFGSIIKGETAERTAEVYNNSEKEISLVFGNIPDFLTVDFDNSPKIAPKTKATIKFLLNSDKSKSWGDISANIQIKINGKIADQNYSIKAKINEDFSKISNEDLKNAPIAVINPKNINLTTIKVGTKRTSKIQLTNNGKTPLLIRTIKIDTDYLTVKPAKNEVAAGKSIDLNITVDATKLDAFQFRKQVKIITNDPVNSVITLMIEWQTE